MLATSLATIAGCGQADDFPQTVSKRLMATQALSHSEMVTDTHRASMICWGNASGAHTFIGHRDSLTRDTGAAPSAGILDEADSIYGVFVAELPERGQPVVCDYRCKKSMIPVLGDQGTSCVGLQECIVTQFRI
jgi:hypothetical protein